MTPALELADAPLALAVSAGKLLAGVLAIVRTREPALALPIFLDLLLAAGLLRLVGQPSWQSIATAAAIVALAPADRAGAAHRPGQCWAREAPG